MIKSYRRRKREAKSEIGRKRAEASNRVQQAARMLREPDADTLRYRALHDARGQVVREGVTYRASSITIWQVRRAVAGRTNQFEFVANGRVKLCAGVRRFPLDFRPKTSHENHHQ